MEFPITPVELADATRRALQQSTTAAPEGGSSSLSIELILMALIGGGLILGALYISQKQSGGSD